MLPTICTLRNISYLDTPIVKMVDACGETLDNVMFGDNQCDFWIPLFTYHDAFACSEEEKITFETEYFVVTL